MNRKLWRWRVITFIEKNNIFIPSDLADNKIWMF